MADTTNLQTYDGIRNINVKLTIESDGTGTANFKIIDVTTLTPNPGLHMKVRRIRYSIGGMYVRLQWEGTPNTDIAILANGQDILDFTNEYAGGFPNNGSTPTGNIVVTTQGQIAGSNATLNLECIKGV
jgi:hypothetical protein